MTPAERKIIEQAIDTLTYCKMANIQIENVNDSLTALRTILEQKDAEPVAKVIKATGSLKDIHIMNWMNEYSPNEGDLLYTHPVQSRDDDEPTYGQLKIRLEKAKQTIEMQRCELFNLRDVQDALAKLGEKL